MANHKRQPIIKDNPALDKIARRFASKIRSLERSRQSLLDQVGAIDKKLTETRAALNALKRGVGAE